MHLRSIGPRNTAQAIANQLQPVAHDVVPVLRETCAVERGRDRTGERP
jgi:hypothetical protein